MRALIALCLLTPALLLPTPPAQDSGAPRGVLLAVGGGGTSDALVARALELAGGPEARMLIVPQASSEPAASGVRSTEFWKEKGAKDVRVLDLGDPAAARAEIEAARFIWMPGGDQKRLMAALSEAGLVEAVRARYRAGALVGGTSAGAAVLSGAMILGGDEADLTAVRLGGTKIGAGLGLWDGAVVDQHFLKRQRFNRLLAAVLDQPGLVGVGIDERTGVVLHADGACEVVGDGAVLVLDARAAERRTPDENGLHSASGVTLSLHRHGERFTLAERAKR